MHWDKTNFLYAIGEKLLGREKINCSSLKMQYVMTLFCILSILSVVITIFTLGNGWLDSDGCGSLMQSLECMKYNTIFPESWHDSTFVHFQTIPTFIAMQFTSNMILARNIASLFTTQLFLISIVYFFGVGLKNNGWTIAIIVFCSFISKNQLQMLFTENYYTWYIMGILFVLGTWLWMTDEKEITDWFSNKKRLVFFLVLLFIVSLMGIRTAQQVTVPLVGTIIILWLYQLCIKKNTCLLEKRKVVRLIGNTFFVLVVALAGCIIAERILNPAVGVNPDTGDSLIMFAPSYQRISENVKALFEGFLDYIGVPLNVSMFSIDGLTGLIRLFFMIDITIVIPLKQVKNFSYLSEKNKEIMVFSGLNAIEIIIILVLGQGTEAIHVTRYLLSSIFLLNLSSVVYLYERYFLEQDVKRTIYSLFLIIFSCTSLITIFKSIPSSKQKLTEERRLTEFLVENGLEYGYATFWNASNNTVFANGNVKISQVYLSESGKISPMLWLSSEDWYKVENYSGKTFLLLAADEINYYAPMGYAETVLGNPEQILNYADYTILIYDYNISMNRFGKS